MSINVFFHISKDFFYQMYSQGIEYEEETTNSVDEEKGFEEWLDYKNEEIWFCGSMSNYKTNIINFRIKKNN